MKKSNLIIGLIILIIIIGIFLYFFPGITTKEITLSEGELSKINIAREEFIAGDGLDPLPIQQLFTELSLDKSLIICNEELILDSLKCYRLLAIMKPEDKEIICSNINVNLCEKYPTLEDCPRRMQQHHEGCLLLFPLVG